MIEKALAQYPGLDFIAGDGRDFTVAQPYDAVFSNAALHWMGRGARRGDRQRSAWR